jgi:hypothetical protein
VNFAFSCEERPFHFSAEDLKNNLGSCEPETDLTGYWFYTFVFTEKE